jgi:nucleoside-diphosphate-sugar epimerase
MNYFLTGATGFIGGRVARQLIEAGHRVIALVRDKSKAGVLKALGVELFEGDITDKECMRQPMSQAEGIFHIAAWYQIGTRDSHLAKSVNVDGTRNVLELMRELKIPKGVYTSTLAVFSDTRGKAVDETYRHDGPWLSEYDRTKWLAHYQVALPLIEQGLPLIIVQPGVVYGPGDTSIMGETFRKYLKRKLPLIPKQTAFCWAHVEDTARGHVLAMEKGKPGESYIIAGPIHTFEEAFAFAEEITGIKAPRLRPSPGIMKMMANLMKIIDHSFELPPDYTSESLRVIAGTTYTGVNSKAKRDLGFHPRPFEEGLRETLLHEMKRLNLDPKAG